MDVAGAVRAPSRPWRRCVLVLLVLQALFGALRLATNVGQPFRDGDTREYIKRSQSLETDAYRGIAYPLLLAAIDRLVDRETLQETWEAVPEEDGADATIPGKNQLLVIQLVQLLAFAGALAWFVRALVPPIAAGTGRLAPRALQASLVLLLLTDPLLAHFQLLVLTDGLTLSVSLVFCAALASSGLGRGPRRGVRRWWVAAAALFLCSLLGANLRVEKGPVFLGTALASPLVWLLLERSRPAHERCLSLSGALRAAAVVVAALALGPLVQRGFESTGSRLPPYDLVLDQRILFPNLAAVYGELPAGMRSRMSRSEAERHDRSLLAARAVIYELSPKDPRARRALLEDSARVVLRERGLRIALDVLKDAVENVVPALSFYGRLGLLRCLGEARFERLIPADWNRVTYQQLCSFHPALARAQLLVSPLLMVLCAWLSVLHLRESGRPRRATWLAWVPVVLFVLLNAFAFALVADFVLARYAIVAHVAWLALVYRGALGWASGGRVTPALPCPPSG